MNRSVAAVSVLMLACSARCLSAQGAVAAHADSTRTQPAPQAVSTPIDFSGLLFGNYQIRTDSAARALAGGKQPNQFTIDRVYLTFRMPVGDRASIRATTDIFQNTTGGYYNGWAMRLKYGFVQYDFLRDIGGHKGFNALGRIGMLHTVVIDHEEQFWPRYMAQTALERFGFFSSSDLGAATQVTLPNKWGEVYATVANGPGYTSSETDRFKDVSLRTTLTPLAKKTGWIKSLAISPWVYKGNTASKFAVGGATQLAPVTDGLARDRWGIFAGVRDPKLTVGAHYARRTEGFETGSNTSASPRAVAPDSTGELFSVFTVIRPLHWQAGKNTSSLGVVARWDDFTPRTSVAGHERAVIAGLQYEPTSKTALTLDYQELTPSGFAGRAPIVKTSTWYLHWMASF